MNEVITNSMTDRAAFIVSKIIIFYALQIKAVYLFSIGNLPRISDIIFFRFITHTASLPSIFIFPSRVTMVLI